MSGHDSDQNIDRVPQSADFVNGVIRKLAAASANIPPGAIPVEPGNRRAKSEVRPFDQESLRPYFLSLHLLFPHILLDALDLLDRGLVNRLRVLHSEECRDGDQREQRYYYVQTAQMTSQSHGRTRATRAGVQMYHVHLAAWNCSCAAFAFAVATECTESSLEHGYMLNSAALPLAGVSPDSREAVYHGFGGVAALGQGEGRLPPVCKHLLACTLVETCENLFGNVPSASITNDPDHDGPRTGIVEHTVSIAAAAGWAVS